MYIFLILLSLLTSAVTLVCLRFHPSQDEMSALLTAANMICAVLRNNEKLSMAARQGGAPGAGGGPGSNGSAGGGGDRERGAPRGGPGPNNGPRGGSGPPPASPSGGATPANFPFQQQQQPVPVSAGLVRFTVGSRWIGPRALLVFALGWRLGKV